MLHAQRTLPFTIIRPPIVQGPHDASLRGWFWYQRVADGGPGNRAAFGKTYNVASEEILSLDDFVRLTASILGVRDPVVTVRSPRGGGRPRDA